MAQTPLKHLENISVEKEDTVNTLLDDDGNVVLLFANEENIDKFSFPSTLKSNGEQQNVQCNVDENQKKEDKREQPSQTEITVLKSNAGNSTSNEVSSSTTSFMEHHSYAAPISEEIIIPTTCCDEVLKAVHSVTELPQTDEVLEAVHSVTELPSATEIECSYNTIDNNVTELIYSIEKLAEKKSSRNVVCDDDPDGDLQSSNILPEVDDENSFSENVSGKNFAEKYPQLFSAVSAQDAQNIINAYAEETFSSFVSMRKMKRYGVTEGGLDINQKNYRVFFESPDIKFDGIPYVHVADKMYICHLGKDKTEATRQKIRQQSLERREKLGLPIKDLPICRIRTKKIDCPVKISVKMIAKFPQFKVHKKSKRICETSSKKVREAMLQSGGKVDCFYQFVGTLPNPDNHNHALGEQSEHEPIDPLIKEKIIQLSWQGITSSTDIKKYIEDYVVNELFAGKDSPAKVRRRYYPSIKDIRNYMNRARVLSRVTADVKAELDILLSQLQQSKPNDHILIQAPDDDVKQSTDDGEKSSSEKASLVFCYQTELQQRLMKRYNRQVYLASINSVTERAPFPTFCLFVQTNVDHQLIALFSVEKRNKISITQGLQTLKEWNQSWCPKYFIVDHSEEVSESVKELFPNSHQYWSSIYREKAWRTWLMKEENHLIGHSSELMTLFQAIADAYNEPNLQLAASRLEESIVWKSHAHLRSWFNDNWLVEAKKWVAGYRPDDFHIMKHGETLKDDLKMILDIHISFTGAKKLCFFIEKLVEKVIPDFYQRYVDLNRKSFSEINELINTHGDLLPISLSNKPAAVIKYIIKQIQLAEKKMFQVGHIHPGVFLVHEDPLQTTATTEEQHATYTVSFGSEDQHPTCECLDWHEHKLPCVHFCSVFATFVDWSFDMMTSSYTSLPQLSFDYACIRPLFGRNAKSFPNLVNMIKTVEIQTTYNAVSTSSQKNLSTNLLQSLITPTRKTEESNSIKGTHNASDNISSKKLSAKKTTIETPPKKKTKFDSTMSVTLPEKDVFRVSDDDGIELVLDLGEATHPDENK